MDGCWPGVEGLPDGRRDASTCCSESSTTDSHVVPQLRDMCIVRDSRSEELEISRGVTHGPSSGRQDRAEPNLLPALPGQPVHPVSMTGGARALQTWFRTLNPLPNGNGRTLPPYC
uniref:Uncharacterized protein n=1 Tax=Peronospora matthiolae TaxID=2874970 RepID=A0AAV1VKA5_9STRA